jgi:hypothetical protein
MTTADRFTVMARQLAGQPVPALPAIPGRVFKRERVPVLLALVFGDDSEPGPVRRVIRCPAVRAELDDP